MESLSMRAGAETTMTAAGGNAGAEWGTRCTTRRRKVCRREVTEAYSLLAAVLEVFEEKVPGGRVG